MSSQHLPILDMDRLDALRRAVGADAFESLADRFGPAVDKDLVRIRGGSTDGTRGLVAEAAHSLKGLALTFGASRLQAAAQALQSAAEGTADLRGLIGEIEEAAVSTKSAVAPAVSSLR